MSKDNPLEKDIEAKVCQYARDKGLLVYKFTSPARSAVPDRLFIRRDGLVFFIEFKRAGKTATPAQLREHQRLVGHCVPVYVVDSVIGGRLVIDVQTGALGG